MHNNNIQQPIRDGNNKLNYLRLFKAHYERIKCIIMINNRQVAARGLYTDEGHISNNFTKQDSVSTLPVDISSVFVTSYWQTRLSIVMKFRTNVNYKRTIFGTRLSPLTDKKPSKYRQVFSQLKACHKYLWRWSTKKPSQYLQVFK